MSERLGFNPEDESSPEISLNRDRIIEICRTYELPPEYMEELEALDDVLELIGTASIWIQEEGHDLDVFLERVEAFNE